jgi:hypothetical protein
MKTAISEKGIKILFAKCCRLVPASALLFVCSQAWAGPPLSIDDPGVLEPGQFEFITAVTMTSVGSTDSHELPLLDISVGVIEDYVQVSAGFAHIYHVPGAGNSENGFGNPEVGLKVRFVNKGRLQLAFAPAYIFGVDQSAEEKGIGHSANYTVLPINAEYQVNDSWRLNAEVVHLRSDDSDSEWGYGAAAAYAIDDRREVLFEVTGGGDRFLGSDSMQARIGLDNALTKSFHLLFSIGTGLRETTPDERVDFDVFLGFKFLR